MKKLFVFTCIIGLLLCTSCKEQSESGAYVIETTIHGIPDGVRAFLKIPNIKGVPQPKDTAIVQNGKFTFTGNVEFPQASFIYVNGAPGNIEFLLENANVMIDAHKDSLSVPRISGGRHNSAHAEFIAKSKEMSVEMQQVRASYQSAVTSKNTTAIADARKKVADLDRQVAEYQEQFVNDYPTAHTSIMLVSRMLRNKLTTPQKANQFLEGLSSDMKKSPVAKDLITKTKELLRTAVGSVAENFTAPNPEGKMVSLNDIKGKVTIIDFWAAWCGPCRRENPNVVKIYNKYHEDGLEIIGVSLDGRTGQNNAKADWLRAIETDGLKWHQVSNLDGFRDAIARTYNIRSIPATFILNEKGQIAAKNLRGSALEAKVKELLGK
ncbi:MAG: TlpA disulfide reductase family protein [Bacteroidota bacterium]